MKVEDIVPFSVFQHIQSGDQCDGKHPGTCKGLDRMIAALDYHQCTIVNPLQEKYGDDPKATFISFCDELYPKTTMLDDYVHFVEHHADPSSLEYIKGRLHLKCESATKCGATTRHYRDRADDHNDGIESVWCIDRIDSVHFMIHHLTELGLRVSLETKESAVVSDDEKQVDLDVVDHDLKRTVKEVDSKRAVFSNERLDGIENTKFTLQISEKMTGTAKGTDGMLSLYILFRQQTNIIMKMKRK